MTRKQKPELSRRERQMMDIIYKLGNATAADVHKHLPDNPSYSSVRTIMRILVEKGHLKYKQDGPRYVYYPTVNQERAKQSALQHVLKTFFDGSTEEAVAALIDMSQSELSKEALQRIAEKIAHSRKEGR